MHTLLLCDYIPRDCCERVNEVAIKDYTQETVDKEWTDSFVMGNAFKPPMFQGEEAFERCVQILAKKWASITAELLKEALMFLDALVDCGGMATLDRDLLMEFNDYEDGNEDIGEAGLSDLVNLV